MQETNRTARHEVSPLLQNIHVAQSATGSRLGCDRQWKNKNKAPGQAQGKAEPQTVLTPAEQKRPKTKPTRGHKGVVFGP